MDIEAPQTPEGMDCGIGARNHGMMLLRCVVVDTSMSEFISATGGNAQTQLDLVTCEQKHGQAFERSAQRNKSRQQTLTLTIYGEVDIRHGGNLQRCTEIPIGKPPRSTKILGPDGEFANLSSM